MLMRLSGEGRGMSSVYYGQINGSIGSRSGAQASSARRASVHNHRRAAYYELDSQWLRRMVHVSDVVWFVAERLQSLIDEAVAQRFAAVVRKISATLPKPPTCRPRRQNRAHRTRASSICSREN